MLKEKMKKPAVQVVAVIFLCFLLTSTGWLIWNHRVHEYLTAEKTNIVTMVSGYFLQALGIGGFAVILRLKPKTAFNIFLIAVVLHMALMVPSVMCVDTAGIASGLVMEFFCGIISGYYLYYYVRKVPKKCMALVFGVGYGLSALASWFLTLTGELYYSDKVLYICAALTAGVICVVLRYPLDDRENIRTAEYPDGRENVRIADNPDDGENMRTAEYPDGRSSGFRHAVCSQPYRKNILLRGILVLLIGVVINCGYSFSPALIGNVVNVELSRLVYAVSLVIAGGVTDRDRKKGAVFAMTALLFPFIMLSLRGEAIPAAACWMLSYFVFGFYSVYRIILFADLDVVYLSGFGLMIGRMGDSAGEIISLLLQDRPVLHVGLAAGLCAAAISIFFRIYHDLYVSGESGIGPELTVSEAAGELQAVNLPDAEGIVQGMKMPETEGELQEAEGIVQGMKMPETEGELQEAEGIVQGMNMPEVEGMSETADAADAELKFDEEEWFYIYAAKYKLSLRERDVMLQILEEKTIREIAESLYISENTVKFHVRNILKKAGCKNRNELVLDYTANSIAQKQSLK